MRETMKESSRISVCTFPVNDNEKRMPSYLMVSAHDVRSARKASAHFIAEELARRGRTRAFSLGFSRLSTIRGRDPRLGLEDQANRVVHHAGIDAYLWRTTLHPSNPRRRFLQRLSPVFFELYRMRCPGILKQWAEESTTIIVESGIGPLMLRDLHRWNPEARLLYLASDDLETIGADPYLQGLLAGAGALLSGVILPSRLLRVSMPAGVPLHYVPHGVTADFRRLNHPRPFGPGVHAVSVGSMLFDAAFFWAATEAFPDVNFHVIGCGVPREALPPQIHYYGEMPFEGTLAFLQHADFGIAPYRLADVPYYLADTSMKLMQYGACGLPAVCPAYAVGEQPLRFGYQPGEAASIARAIEAALQCGRTSATSTLDWREVTDRILDPGAFTDTATPGETP